MITHAKPIVCLGILVADIVARPLNALPDRGQLVLVDEMGIHTGGCATNSASALARLGLPVEAIGKVGSDLAGDFVLNAMQERGVGTRGVHRDPLVGTSLTIVLVDPDGERRFVHCLGANACLTLQDIDLEIIEGASILHIGGALVLPGIDGEPMAELLRKARAAGVVTFLDIVWDDTGRWLEVLEPCLPWVDYFIPSLPEARVMTGLEEPLSIAHNLLARGPNVVGLKLGAQGCLVITQSGEIISAPAFQVEVVDATGAGDAFAAGFIAGVWQGWPLDKTAHFANAVGALCTTGSGAEGGVLPLSETLQFMEMTPIRTQ
jgi:sugar/nucleoside kinase (ribokinase family)